MSLKQTIGLAALIAACSAPMQNYEAPRIKAEKAVQELDQETPDEPVGSTNKSESWFLYVDGTRPATVSYTFNELTPWDVKAQIDFFPLGANYNEVHSKTVEPINTYFCKGTREGRELDYFKPNSGCELPEGLYLPKFEN